MEPGDIAKRVYREIGLSEPEVQRYPTIEDAISNFSSWKSHASPLVANNWEYQYPLLNPYCQWAQFRLYDDGFQFDLTRTPSERGCYFNVNFKSKIPFTPKELCGIYISEAIEAVRKNPENEVDGAVKQIVDEHEEFIEELTYILDREEPSCQLPVDCYVFLGSFSWLRIERDILRHMRARLKKLVCDEHYQNVSLLCDSNILFFTFRNLVVWAPLPECT